MQEPNTTPATGEVPPQVEPAAPQVDAAYGETWFTTNGTIAPPRPALPNDLDVDVCIIGGGLAGLTIAREVARRKWSVAVLEARRVAWNASSRNTGFVMPGFAPGMHKLIARAGPDRARELWMLSQDGVDYVRRSIKDGHMRDVMQSEGWLHVSKIDRAKEISDEAELLRGLGADIEVWPTTLVRSKVKSPYYFQAIHFPTAFNIHPYNYALAIAQSAEDAGARIFEETAAISIDPAGVRKRVVTPQGRIRAAHIVFAGNVHLGPIMPDIAQTLIPVHTFAMVTKPLGGNLDTALEYPGAVSDTAFADHHYRVVGGDRLMFAGRVATRDANPRRHGRRLRADLRRRFPQLGPVEIEHAWSGTIGVTVHGMPQIGEVSPGVWLASGFGAHGLNTTAMAANLIAGAILDGDDRFRLFEPFELVWAGGRLGRFVAKRFYLAQRAYEQWASRRSRKRELWWIKNEPRLKREAEEAAERARIRAEQAAIAEAERIEREKIEAEQAEVRRIERERIAAEKAEAKRIRAEEKAAAKAEAARLKEEQRAARRAEKERIAAEKAEAKRLAAERLAAERAEAERIAAEQAKADRVEADRKAAEQAEAERLEAERQQAEADRGESGPLAAAAAAASTPDQASAADSQNTEADRAQDQAQTEGMAQPEGVAQPDGAATPSSGEQPPPNSSDEAAEQTAEDSKPQPRKGFWRRR